jgi:hypothetical protein
MVEKMQILLIYCIELINSLHYVRLNNILAEGEEASNVTIRGFLFWHAHDNLFNFVLCERQLKVVELLGMPS